MLCTQKVDERALAAKTTNSLKVFDFKKVAAVRLTLEPIQNNSLARSLAVDLCEVQTLLVRTDRKLPQLW